jgi:hypothetical protein
MMAWGMVALNIVIGIFCILWGGILGYICGAICLIIGIALAAALLLKGGA